MLIYYYDKEGKFTRTDEAELCPIELTPLIPLNATTEVPPLADTNCYVAFCDGAWHQIQIPEQQQTPSEIISKITSDLRDFYDSVAQSKQYDNRLTCIARAGYTGPFQAEGLAFAQWVDSCVVYANNVQNDCLAGTRSIPTSKQLISELPTMVWPN